MKLFGKDWTRQEILERVGDIRQVGGAQPVILDDGPERGVRAIEVRTGTGFRFTVLPDRGMDLWHCEYQGMPLAWISPTGPVAPAFYEAEGLGWLRGFPGGMLTTCGLTLCGPPSEGRGLHGRASYTPASEVAVSGEWEDDDYFIEVRGKVREAMVFGEHLVLRRRITTQLGSNSLVVADEVENAGHEPAPLMLLYHVNGGFPVLDEKTELLVASAKVDARSPEGAKENPLRFQAPAPGYAERVYLHALKDGVVALVNRGLKLGYALRFDLAELPCFTEWKMMGRGLYVVGTEPGNVNPEARETLRKEGRLPMLAPGETRSFEVEIQALGSLEEIRAVEEEIRSPGKE